MVTDTLSNICRFSLFRRDLVWNGVNGPLLEGVHYKNLFVSGGFTVPGIYGIPIKKCINTFLYIV